VRTTLIDGYASHDRWETFTSSGVLSNYSSSTSVTRGFKVVSASSTMIKYSPISTKNQKGG